MVNLSGDHAQVCCNHIMEPVAAQILSGFPYEIQAKKDSCHNVSNGKPTGCLQFAHFTQITVNISLTKQILKNNS